MKVVNKSAGSNVTTGTMMSRLSRQTLHQSVYGIGCKSCCKMFFIIIETSKWKHVFVANLNQSRGA